MEYKISNNLAIFLNKPFGSTMTIHTEVLLIRESIKKNNIKKRLCSSGIGYELDDFLKTIFEPDHHCHINDFNMPVRLMHNMVPINN